jgi:O2-independent ubiquinone biosynthesis accessory factor UbiT
MSDRAEPQAQWAVPRWLRPLHEQVCRRISHLPVAPPSMLVARLLDRLLWPRLPADARVALRDHCVELCVTDLGLRMRLRLTDIGFSHATERGVPDLRIAAPSRSFMRLLRGDDDPDRLFFEKALVMEGDTELGLVLKNTLDAIGPIWPRPER